MRASVDKPRTRKTRPALDTQPEATLQSAEATERVSRLGQVLSGFVQRFGPEQPSECLEVSRALVLPALFRVGILVRKQVLAAPSPTGWPRPDTRAEFCGQRGHSE